MAPPWKAQLRRWLDAGLIDPTTAGAIERWEAGQSPSGGLAAPVLLALVLGLHGAGAAAAARFPVLSVALHAVGTVALGDRLDADRAGRTGVLEATTFTYGWNAIGGLLLVSWGVAEARAERINMGVAVVALTVLTFYFSEVMDKLGRSASLIGLGVLFLAGGWGMETMRRRLVATTRRPATGGDRP